MTRSQFEAFCEDDPLRFSEPALFAKLQREFAQVFDQTD
jgi:hypothetical protein